MNNLPLPWATKINSRSPKFKIHYNKTHALSAIRNASIREDEGRLSVPDDVILYTLKNNEWTEVAFERLYERGRNPKVIEEVE